MLKNTLVFGFEPDKNCIAEIIDGPSDKKKIKKEHINKNFFIVPCAIHNDLIDTSYLYTETNSNKSSMYLKRNDDDSDSDSDSNLDSDSYKKSVSIPTFSLTDFFDLLEPTVIIDYIKINTNGNDFNVIRSLKDSLFKRVGIITVNCNNNYKNAFNNYYDILRYLHDRSFKPVQELKIQLYKSFNVDPTFYNTTIDVTGMSYYQIASITADDP
jgi:hypothetical protein